MSSISRATHLYAIRARFTPFVKIGITSDPIERIKRMQTDNPHALRYIICVACDQAYDVEYWMHRQFRRRHIRGEWFWVYRDRPIVETFLQGLALSAQGEIPIAPSPLAQYLLPAPKKQSVIIDIPEDHPVLVRLRTERTRATVVEALILCGWTITDLRRENILRGDNVTISQEVAETRKRLGLADPDRTLKIRDEKGERVIPV